MDDKKLQFVSEFVRELEQHGDVADPQTNKESLDHEHQRLINEALKAENSIRSIYATFAPWLIIIWLLVVLGILFLQGCSEQASMEFSIGVIKLNLWPEAYFHLSDSVLIALLSGTTASVISIFIVIAKFFQRTPPKKARKCKKKG